MRFVHQASFYWIVVNMPKLISGELSRKDLLGLIVLSPELVVVILKVSLACFFEYFQKPCLPVFLFVLLTKDQAPYDNIPV